MPLPDEFLPPLEDLEWPFFFFTVVLLICVGRAADDEDDGFLAGLLPEEGFLFTTAELLGLPMRL